MTNTLHETVERCFKDLVREHGFRVHGIGYNPEDFGNEAVVLESDDFSIRVIRDRGEILIEIASPVDRENWHPIERVFEVLCGNLRMDLTSGEKDLIYVASQIRINYQAITTGLSLPHYEETQRELNRLAALRRNELLFQPE